jgi:hypothetical protein
MKLMLSMLFLGIAFGQEFTVRETAGLRRFGYPVRATMSRLDAGPLVLLEEGKPVPAQFTPRSSNSMDIDFVVSLGPYETRRFRVEKGLGPAPPDGMQCEETAGSLLARQAGGLDYAASTDLLGLLREVGTPTLQYLRPGSFGLGLTFRNGDIHRARSSAKGEIFKNGPLACGFRFEEPGGSQGIGSSTVEMEIPRTKSWVEVRWEIEDPEDGVSGLFADLNLAVEPPRTLVDFGVGSYVYVALRPGEEARMHAASGKWQIDVGGRPYAEDRAYSVEGWAHLMDSTRATAVAVEDFGRGRTEGEMRVQSDGRLVIRRNGLRGEKKTLHFWLHFVAMPVQVGAATSPQSMMSPLAVDWK